MFRMGGGEWVMIAFVAMLFMGPKQVKALMGRLKETVALLKDSVDDLDKRA